MSGVDRTQEKGDTLHSRPCNSQTALLCPYNWGEQIPTAFTIATYHSFGNPDFKPLEFITNLETSFPWEDGSIFGEVNQSYETWIQTKFKIIRTRAVPGNRENTVVRNKHETFSLT